MHKIYRVRFYKKVFGVFTWCYKYSDYATLEYALKQKANFNEIACEGHWADVEEI